METDVSKKQTSPLN